MSHVVTSFRLNMSSRTTTLLANLRNLDIPGKFKYLNEHPTYQDSFKVIYVGHFNVYDTNTRSSFHYSLRHVGSRRN